MARGPQFRVRVDATKTEAGFKEARKAVNGKVREGLTQAASRTVLPKVRLRAPTISKEYITAKATSRRAYITTKGPKVFDRITGLLNFGGTVRSDIYPKARPTDGHAPALSINGSYRGAVHSPRHYRGKHFLEKGVEESLPGIESALEAGVMAAFKQGGLAE